MVYFVLKTGETMPCVVATSKRTAVSLTLAAMMQEKIITLDNMVVAKNQLNEIGVTVGFSTDYKITEVKTNTYLQ